jgi:2-keto-4-pentenoate hydratase/2-oxohepta-3-ene-1,7-dioic acid hydratase in catechol pathway
VIGPGDPIAYPPISKRMDYEGELACVIGQVVRRVGSEDAARAILGYTCANDVTLRDLQATDSQWIRAKGFDTSCPLGPWLETDLDPSDVALETRVNGEVRQSARTAQLAFDPAELVAYISSFMTLLPGDVVLTGTPAGVGPLEVGDEVQVSVEGVGTLSNTVVAG